MAHPGIRRKKGGTRQRHRRRFPAPIRQAAPGPVLSATNEAGRQRVALDIPADAQQPAGGLDDMRFESALIDRSFTHALSQQLKPHRMGSCYPMHEPREALGSRRADDEMPVIVHDTVGDNRHRMLRQPCSENLEEVAIILRSQEQRHSAITAVDDVKIVFGIQASGSSRHIGTSWISKANAEPAKPRPVPHL